MSNDIKAELESLQEKYDLAREKLLLSIQDEIWNVISREKILREAEEIVSSDLVIENLDELEEITPLIKKVEYYVFNLIDKVKNRHQIIQETRSRFKILEELFQEIKKLSMEVNNNG